jgi:HSP20 family protein
LEAAPRTCLRETDDAYVVEFRVPGAKKRDIEVSVAGRHLTASGQHQHRCGLPRRQTRRVERFWSEVLLPGEVDDNGVHANLDDGVLTVRVPKAPSERRRLIPVR